MEIYEIKRLDKFVEYCEEVIENDKDESLSQDWVLLTLMGVSKITKDELLSEIEATLTIYYVWLAEAITLEFYNFASIIRDTISIEIRHYLLLANGSSLKINDAVAELNKRLKKTYLNE